MYEHISLKLQRCNQDIRKKLVSAVQFYLKDSYVFRFLKSFEANSTRMYVAFTENQMTVQEYGKPGRADYYKNGLHFISTYEPFLLQKSYNASEKSDKVYKLTDLNITINLCFCIISTAPIQPFKREELSSPHTGIVQYNIPYLLR